MWLTACASATQRQQQPEVDATARLHIAETAAASGNDGMAVAMYQQAAAGAPKDVALQVRVADALVTLGHADAARTLLTDRLRTAPTQPDLLRGQARVYVVSGEAGRAVPMFDALLAANPKDVAALVDKAVALDLMERHSEAQALYARALRSAPDDPVIRNDLAMSRMLDGKLADATAELAGLNGRIDLPARARTNLGLFYAASGDFGDSRAMLPDRSASDQDVTAMTAAIRARMQPATGAQ